MSALIEAVTFLVAAYWPYLALAAAIGLVTGWLSLGKKDDSVS